MSSWEAFLLDLLNRSYCWRQFGFSHKVVSDSCDPMNCSLPGSSVHGILQQEYWNGLPFPSSGDLPNPGIKPGSPALQADDLLTELLLKAG